MSLVDDVSTFKLLMFLPSVNNCLLSIGYILSRQILNGNLQATTLTILTQATYKDTI